MASVTIGETEYPVYESVADADAYLTADPYRSLAWSTRTETGKAQGLGAATRLIASQPDWCSTPVDPASGTIPQALADATAALAADILSKPAIISNPSGASNIKRAKAGSAEVEYFNPTLAAATPPLPSAVWQMLVNGGILGCAAAGDATADPYFGGMECQPRGGCWGGGFVEWRDTGYWR